MSLKINEKEYLSAREAGALFGYTADYISKLCREGEVVSERVGRSWYVEAKSLESFVLRTSAEEQRRLKVLSRERIEEYKNEVQILKHSFVGLHGSYAAQLGRVIAATAGVSAFILALALGQYLIHPSETPRVIVSLKNTAAYTKDALTYTAGFLSDPSSSVADVREFFPGSIHRAPALTSEESNSGTGKTFLSYGTWGSRCGHDLFYPKESSSRGAACVSWMRPLLSSALSPLNSFLVFVSDQFNRIGELAIATLLELPETFGAMRSHMIAAVGSVLDSAVHVTTPTTTLKFLYGSFWQKLAGWFPAPAVPQIVADSTQTSAEKTGSASTRVVERVTVPQNVTNNYSEYVSVSGVSEERLLQLLSVLENSLKSEIYKYSASLERGVAGNTIAIQHTNRIDQLSSVDITNSTWKGGSVSANDVSGESGNFTALTVDSLTGLLAAVNGVVSATSSLSIAYGGTGTTTAPAYGQVLVGDSSGNYSLTATSSLGISGGAALTGGINNTLAAWTSGTTIAPTSTQPLYVGSLFATSTILTSYFGGRLTVGTTSATASLTVWDEGTSGTGSIFNVVGTTASSTLFTVNRGGNVGVGTSSPYAKFSVAGESLAGYFTATNTNSTSTFAGGLQALHIQTNSINATGTATSTIAGGLNITGGGLTLNSISGFLKATAGAVSTALVNLAADVTGILPIANGGTNASALSSSLLWFNGTSIQATSSQVTVGSLVSTTTATSTFAGGVETTNIGALTSTSTFRGVQIQSNGLKIVGLSGALFASAAGDVTAGTLSIANGGTATTTFYDGGVLFYNGTLGTLSQSAAASNFFWDETNKRLGLGTSSPYANLSIAGVSGQASTTALFAIGSSTPLTGGAYFAVSGRGVADLRGRAIDPAFIAEEQGTTPGTSLNLAISVFVSGNYAYVANNARDSLAVIDISNPADPVFVSEEQGTTPGTTLNGAISVFVSGNYAYVANTGRDSLAVIDISNPADPVFVSEERGPTPGTSLDGAQSVFVSGNYAYVANDSRHSLAVIDISNPADPVFVSEERGTTPGTTLSGAISVFVSGNYAYVANSGRDSLAVIDISNPADPVFVSEERGTTPGTTLDEARGVFVSGNYAYVANGTRASLAVIDISNPADPVFVSEEQGTTPGTTLDGAYGVFVSGNYAYVANNFRHSLAIIDISNPADPVFVSEERGTTPGTTLNGAISVFVSGNYAYVANSVRDSLAVIDVGGGTFSNLAGGSLKADTLQVNNFAQFAQGGFFGGGLGVQGNLFANQGGSFMRIGTSTALASTTLAWGNTPVAPALSALIHDASVGSISDVFSITHTATSSGVAGIGTGFLFNANTACTLGNSFCLGTTTSATSTARIAALLTDASTTTPASALSFYTKESSAGLTEWARLTSSGSFGLGTTSPTARLSVWDESTSGTGGIFNVVGSAASSTLFTVNRGGNVGVGTSSPYAKFSVAGESLAGYFTATNTNSTSTFAGGLQALHIQTNSINATGTATSTIAGGLNITGGGLTLGGVTGFLKATAGAITNSLISLTADITGVLPIANGGTNASALSSSLLWFNGTSIQATSSQVTVGSLVSTTTATSTFAGGVETTNIGALTSTSTFRGVQIHSNGLKIVGLSGALFASAAGDVTAGTLSIASGGTNATRLSNALLWFNGTSVEATSSQVSVGNLVATTTATSTFQGGISALRLYTDTIEATSTNGFNYFGSRVGIGSSSPSALLSLEGTAGAVTGGVGSIFHVASSSNKTPFFSIAAVDGRSAFGTSTATTTQSALLTLWDEGAGAGSSFNIVNSASSTIFSVNRSITSGTSTLANGLQVLRLQTGTIEATSTTATSTIAGGLNITGGGLTLNSISGFLKATAGAVSTALVNLAADVTGVLPIANGGTNASALSSSLLWFNGTSIQATSSQVTVGNLVATTTATSTFAGGVETTNIGALTSTSTFRGVQIHSNGLKIVGLSGALFASAAGDVTAGTLSIASGGTNATRLSNALLWFNGTSVEATSSQVSVGNLVATTTATSTFQGGISALRLYTDTIEATSTSASSIFSFAPTFSTLTSALILTGSTGLTAEYTGVTCTNQFLRALNALGAGTCATVGTSDVSGLDISADTNLTAGDGLTLTNDDIDLDPIDLAGLFVTGTLPIASGGTNATQLSKALLWFDGTSIAATSSQVTVGNLVSTTTATSTFAGGISVTATSTFAKSVGIGTTSPAGTLSVLGGGGVPGGAAPYALYAQGADFLEGGGGIYLKSGGDGGTATGATFTVAGSNSNGGNITLDPGMGVVNTGVIVLASTNGNVGVGTTSPAMKLSVQGAALVSGNLSVAGLTATGTIAFNQQARTSGAIPYLTLTGGADTGLTAATEAPDVQWNLARTKSHANGSIALERNFLINAPTETFSSYSVGNQFVDLATVGITGAPILSTTANGTSTNSHTLYLGASALTSSTTNSYGLTINANTGATNNFAAQFLGGNVGVGTSSPYAKFSVAGESLAGYFTATNTNSTSTFSGGLQVLHLQTNSINATGTATSTIAGGLNITGGGLTLHNISGFLKATAGAVANSLIDLAADVTGVLPIANGGTNASALSSSLLWFNGTSIQATSSQVTVGSLVSTTTATSTFAGGVAASNFGATGTSTFAGLQIQSGGLKLALNCSGASSLLQTSATGDVICGDDDSTAGGAANSKWATSTDATAVYPTNAKAIVINGTATSTQNVAIQAYGLVEGTYFSATSTTATSTFAGGLQALHLQTNSINATGTATSTIAGGLNITGGGLTLHNISGFLKATAGAVANSLIDLAADVTGVLPIANGGTNASALSSSLLWFDGTRIAATSSQVTIGSLLATSTATSTFVGGWQNFNAITVSTTTATSTFANGINLTGGCFAVSGTCLSSGGGTPAGNSGEIQFNNGGSFGGASTFNWDSVENRLALGTSTASAKLTIWDEQTSGKSAFNIMNSASSTLLTVLNTGRVGIGTTTPNWLLSVSGTTGTRLKTTTDITSAFAIENSLGTSTLSVDTLADTSAIFSVASSTGTEYFQIAGGGNIGVATTSPWRTLSVSGTVGFEGLTTNIGGVTSALCLDGNNEVTRNTDNETCVASSIRYKQNVETFTSESALATLAQLRPVSFEFKNATGTVHYGFIAEEVELVDPRLVSYTADGLPQSVRYIEIIPLLTQAVQEINLNLQAVASSTASSTPETLAFAQRFFENLFARVTAWLADAANGIGAVFAESFHAKEEICVDDQCLTKEDVRALLVLARGGGMATPPAPAPEPEPAPTDEADTTPPTITVVGNNPATIQVGSSYADLGATVTDTVNDNLGYSTFLDGVEVISSLNLDTTVAGTHTIIYRATDQAGNIGEATRTVIVEDGASTPAPEPALEAIPEPAPEPTPEPQPAPPQEEPTVSAPIDDPGATSPSSQNP